MQSLQPNTGNLHPDVNTGQSDARKQEHHSCTKIDQASFLFTRGGGSPEIRLSLVAFLEATPSSTLVYVLEVHLFFGLTDYHCLSRLCAGSTGGLITLKYICVF